MYATKQGNTNVKSPSTDDKFKVPSNDIFRKELTKFKDTIAHNILDTFFLNQRNKTKEGMKRQI